MASSTVNRSYRTIAICMGLLRVAGGRSGAGVVAGGAETAAVLVRADPEGADEGAAHRLGGAVPAEAGGLLDAVGGVLHPVPGQFEPDPVDIATWRHTDFGGEGPRELARGQPGPAGQRLYRQVRVRVIGDPALHLAQRLPVGQLGGELGAELGLVARAAQEHD